jgi:hypothetical protein
MKKDDGVSNGRVFHLEIVEELIYNAFLRLLE